MTRMTKLDHPLIRESNQCPICNLSKEVGLVSCWHCFRGGVKHGEPAAEAKLDEVEAMLRDSEEIER